MTDKGKGEESILQPFGWRSLAWAAVIEATVRAGETVFDVPTQYNSFYSVLAGQTMESARLAIKRARTFLRDLLAAAQSDALPDDVPDSIRPHLTPERVDAALKVLDEAERRWLTTVNRVLEKNPYGLKAGLAPWHVM